MSEKKEFIESWLDDISRAQTEKSTSPPILLITQTDVGPCRLAPSDHDCASFLPSASRSSTPTDVRLSSRVRDVRLDTHYAGCLKYIPCPDQSTPQCVIGLIKELPLHGTGVIPGCLKERIETDFPFEDIPDYAFSTSASANPFSDEALWTLTKSILQSAEYCFVNNQDEYQWWTIARTLLHEVTRQQGLEDFLSVENIRHTSINSNTLLPHIRDVPVPPRVPNLVLSVSNLNHRAAVYKALRNAYRRMPLSQTTGVFQCGLTFPGCAEVGDQGGSYLEASLTLGVWSFAALKQLEELANLSRGGEQIPTNSDHHDGRAAEVELPLFGWTVIGMDWKLHFAYRDKLNGGVVLLGPLNSGGTNSVFSLFTLIRTASGLAGWTKEKYWPEFERMMQRHT